MFAHPRQWLKGRSQRRQDGATARKYRAVPKLETLEDRCVPAVFNVNSTADLLVPPAGVVTLRSAIDAANPDGPTSTGGGIRDQGNTDLTLFNMVVTRNNATGDGGGIVMENTVNSSWILTINNSTISNNHAGDAGGGIDTDGAGTV